MRSGRRRSTRRSPTCWRPAPATVTQRRGPSSSGLDSSAMSPFSSEQEFRAVMDKVFTIMSTDPEMGPKLREARVPQRFEFPDQDAVVNITFDDSGGDQNLRWEWTDDVGWEPKVSMTMSSEVANRYFQGKEKVPL